MTKKTYVKPEVVCEREIEALTGVCQTGDGPGPTGADKLSPAPVCLNPTT